LKGTRTHLANEENRKGKPPENEDRVGEKKGRGGPPECGAVGNGHTKGEQRPQRKAPITRDGCRL